MDHTHIITARDLNEYASRLDSRRVIPELVHWLVQNSVSSLSECRIPYGDQIHQQGWDGFVDTADGFREFVPKGESYWEIGTGKDPQTKATGDFSKRLNTLSQTDRSDASYIFVTPRTSGWDQAKWRQDRKDSGWAQIRIIDGIKLADWLREFPAIGKWMAKKIGIMSGLGGIKTPREHWDNLIDDCSKNTGDPPLPPDLFTAARSNACDALESIFGGDEQTLLLFAESEFDVEDFVAAYLSSLGEDGRIYTDKCLFISDEDAWRSVAGIRRRHVLVASPKLGLDSDSNLDLQRVATNKGHAVIIPLCGARSGGNREIIKLGRLSQQAIEIILKEAGYPDVRARELVGISGDSISALQRHLSGHSAFPPYATWENTRKLAQAGLLGKWDGNNEDDRTAIEHFSGKGYGEWIETLRPDVLRSGTPLVQTNEKWRLIVRGEAWNALGNQITDEDLNRLEEIAVMVLGERDPKFDLPEGERFSAGIFGKQLKYSKLLREGLAETLALLGSKPDSLSSCSDGKAENTAILTVRKLLHKESWERWVSLDALLPLLAEAAPDEFLDAVESVLIDLEKTPFHNIFAQEGKGGALGGWNYMSGLLWALETLAWHPDYLTRVAVILADIASIDPGGQSMNRPANSLTKILLPWLVQTAAPFEKQEAAIKAVLKEQPDVGWKLILSLLPHNHGVTNECHKPTWREYIPRDWKNSVKITEYWKQIIAYTGIAVELAKESKEKLNELIKEIANLPQDGRDIILNHLASDKIVKLPEIERLPLWENMNKLVRKHRKHADAKWAIPEEIISKIEEVANILEPESSSLKHRQLFTTQYIDLMDGLGSFKEQHDRLDKIRQDAIREIIDKGSIKDILDFAHRVASPREVGHALGSIDIDEECEEDIFPFILDSTDDTKKEFALGFVNIRYRTYGCNWIDDLLAKDWTYEQKVKLLILLPFEEKNWERVENILPEEYQKFYWQNVQTFSHNPGDNITIPVEKLLKCKRVISAINYIAYVNLVDNNDFDQNLALRTLSQAHKNPLEIHKLNQNLVIKLIERLQESKTIDQDALFIVEWQFLPLLGKFSVASPVTLEKKLASDPKFFVEVLSLVFRSESKKDNTDIVEIDDRTNLLLKNAYALLRNWTRCPGTMEDGSFNADAFKEWLPESLRIARNEGYSGVAQSQIGRILVTAPLDPSGLWIHEAVAEVLDERDAQAMRSGYTAGLFDQRGAYTLTGGKGELKLAEENRKKADALEEKGFSRFATAMREFAKDYERDAERQAKGGFFDD